MSYEVSHMIGIRLGGVLGGTADIDDLKSRVAKVVVEMKLGNHLPDIGDDPSHCMSQELVAHKGSYAVIAGVYNYWSHDSASAFAARLSKEFGTEVVRMSWDEENDTVECDVFALAPITLGVLQLLLIACGWYWTWELAASLGSKVPFLWACGVLVPLMSIILLLALMGSATARIKAAGVKVGLMGADLGQFSQQRTAARDGEGAR